MFDFRPDDLYGNAKVDWNGREFSGILSENRLVRLDAAAKSALGVVLKLSLYSAEILV